MYEMEGASPGYVAPGLASRLANPALRAARRYRKPA
jgi:hypothetical protein